MYNPDLSEFSPFDLQKLLVTCFGSSNEPLKLCILIDLPDLDLIKSKSFATDEKFAVQKHAVDKFLTPLRNTKLENFNVSSVDFFAYKTTYGSNLDPEDGAVDESGSPVSLSRNVYPNYDIILAITDYSLTAPLTAQAKIHGFRGATLHGLNDIILNSGLSVDYNFVSKQAEVFRQVITFTDHFDINFKALDRSFKLTLRCDKQDAQKSHGLCPAGKPDVANLPAGEVYFVPNGAEGSFPFRYSDGTIAEMIVEDGAIIKSNLISGDQDIVDARNTQLKEDPATGILGELGFGTQLLPVSGKDIQDEKIFGTCHVATGRSDHLGGNLTPELFNSKMNASHDDILYAPHKTPEISVSSVVMHKNGETQEIFSDYFPSPWLLDRVSTVYPAEKFLVSA
jgi:hypothetical protein